MNRKFLLSALLVIVSLSIGSTPKRPITYTLTQVSPPLNYVENNKYVYPNADYSYIISTDKEDFSQASFKIKVENGTLTDAADSIVGVNVGFKIKWADIANAGNTFAIVKITKATPDNADADSLIAGTPIQYSYQIASLKGQTPELMISANPPMGSKQSFTAQILQDVIYPGIYVGNGLGVTTNLKAHYYEWTLPLGWTVAGQSGTSFILPASQKSITVIPNLVTAGNIEVRALNQLQTAGSETNTYALDRGFSLTSYPESIVFGDNTTRTFSTTLVTGLTYEWEAPSGWQINGMGNTLTGLNLNGVAITPSFCSATFSKVKVRLKKDGEVSPWYEFSTEVTGLPALNASTSTIYQYEKVAFSLANINPALIQSISFTGDDIILLDQEGSIFSVYFRQVGTVTLNALVSLIGCSTAIPLLQTVTVRPHRISLSGPVQLCSQSSYTINNMPTHATVGWNGGSKLNLSSIQGNIPAIFTKTGNGKSVISATVTIGSDIIHLPLNVSVGVPDRPWTMKGSTIYNGSTATYTMCIGQGTTSLYLAFLAPENSADVSSWEVEKKINPENFSVVLSGNNLFVNPLNTGGGSFTVKARNSCGVSSEMTIYLTINTCGNVGGPPIKDPPGWPIDLFSVHPNPATNLLTVELISTEQEGADVFRTLSSDFEPYTVQLWNEYRGFVRSFEITEPIQQISLVGLPPGMYILFAVRKGETLQRKVIWKN